MVWLAMLGPWIRQGYTYAIRHGVRWDPALLARMGSGFADAVAEQLGSQMWDYQIVEFAGQGFRCIAFDRRGHGRFDQPGRGYEFDIFAVMSTGKLGLSGRKTGRLWEDRWCCSVPCALYKSVASQ